MLTDGADTRNFNYHTIGDTIGTLNFNFMEKVVKATLATVAELAVPISAGYDEFDLAPLSVHDHSKDFPAKIDIYPNPSNGQLFLKISTEEALKNRIQIFELNGKIMWSQVINFNPGESIVTLDIKDLKSGNYIIVISSGENTVSKSLILNRD
jgi:hypothetical protein